MTDERSANAVDRLLGQRMRARRLEVGLSQERLADLLGVTFQQVQKYEKGVNRVAASRLFEVASALDVPVGYFFDGISASRMAMQGRSLREEHDDTLTNALANPEAYQLLALFATLKNPRLRRRVVDLVRALCDEDETEASNAS